MAYTLPPAYWHSAHVLTFLQDVQVLPQNVAGEGWRDGQELLLAQIDHGTALHLVEGVQVHGDQRELILGPVEPVDDMLLRPFTGICMGKNTKKIYWGSADRNININRDGN